ncbi:hypothetical protein ACWCWD_08070 [Streptomyces sp. NPDC001493]
MRGVKISDRGEPDAFVASYRLVTDGRLSTADLGVYLRCQWLLFICGRFGDVDWLIRECDMPEAETRESVARLIALGYLDRAGADEIEFHHALSASEGIRRGIETTVDQLSPTERAAVARFADLVDERLEEAGQRFSGQAPEQHE